MKRKCIILVLVFVPLFSLDAQTRPRLVIRDFSGGPGYDGRTIAAMLSDQDSIRNNFTVVSSNAEFSISGTIEQHGFGHTVQFQISRGTTVLGRETVWYRDIIEFAGFLPVIAGNLASRAVPGIAVVDNITLPQAPQTEERLPITPPQPVSPPQPIAQPQPVPPPQPVPSPQPAPALPAISGPSAEQQPATDDAWKNKLLYLGMGMGIGGISTESSGGAASDGWYWDPYYGYWVGGYHYEYWETSDGFAMGFMADFALTRWLSLGINLSFFGGETILPLLAKFGWRFNRIELSFNFGYEPVFGLGLVGGTFGVKAGRGIIFFDAYYGWGNYSDMGLATIGYKIGLINRKR